MKGAVSVEKLVKGPTKDRYMGVAGRSGGSLINDILQIPNRIKLNQWQDLITTVKCHTKQVEV